MKIDLETLAIGFQSIRKLSAIDLGDPKTNFKFMGVVDTVETGVRKYDKQRLNIAEKYGIKNNSGDYFIPPEKLDACNKELDELGVIEIDLEWDIIDLPIESLKGFTPNDMKCLNGKIINIKGE